MPPFRKRSGDCGRAQPAVTRASLRDTCRVGHDGVGSREGRDDRREPLPRLLRAHQHRLPERPSAATVSR
jgi:hypothetical protein